MPLTVGARLGSHDIVAQRDGGLFQAKTGPHLLSLHGDPRWEALLKQLALQG